MSLYIPTFSEKRIVAQSRGAESCNPGLWRGCVFTAPLDEPGGLKADDLSGYRNNGTLTLMDPATDHVVTPMGRALDFDGTDDYVLSPGPISSILIPTAPCTLSCWFSPSSVARTDTLLALGRAGSIYRYYALLFAGATAIDPVQFVARGSSATRTATSTTGVSGVGAICHVLGVQYSSSSRAVYLNGGGEGTDANATGTAETGTDGMIGVGGRENSADPFIGKVWNALIWNRALTVSEIRSLYTDPWGMHTLRRRVQVRGAGAGTTIRWPWQQRRHRRMAGAR